MSRPSPPSGPSCPSRLSSTPKPESQISRRVRQAALAAGVGDGFPGNSGRVGKVWDMLDEGSDLPELMEACRWQSAVTPARYIKKKDEISEARQDEALTGATI